MQKGIVLQISQETSVTSEPADKARGTQTAATSVFPDSTWCLWGAGPHLTLFLSQGTLGDVVGVFPKFGGAEHAAGVPAQSLMGTM